MNRTVAGGSVLPPIPVNRPKPEPPKLTRTQLKVMPLLADGLTNQQIAEKLGTTRLTVNNYVIQVMDRIGPRSRLKLALWWVKGAGIYQW